MRSIRARQSAVCSHCAHDRPVKVHCIVHCSGHYSWSLFKKKKNTNLTLGIWGVTKIHTDNKVVISITLLFGRMLNLVKRFH